MNQREQRTAYIDAELEEIIPMFFENLQAEINELREAFSQKAYEIVQRLGHSIKGSSLGYGFEELGEIGLKIEEAASTEQHQELSHLINELLSYIDTVHIVYK